MLIENLRMETLLFVGWGEKAVAGRWRLTPELWHGHRDVMKQPEIVSK
jgi:hypothetical protein